MNDKLKNFRLRPNGIIINIGLNKLTNLDYLILLQIYVPFSNFLSSFLIVLYCTLIVWNKHLIDRIHITRTKKKSNKYMSHRWTDSFSV